MKATLQNTAVINAFTDRHEWVRKVEAAMKEQIEIVLLLRPANDWDQTQLRRLVRQYGYSAPTVLPPSRWDEYKTRLQLSDLATKEQAITPETVYLLRPG